MAGVADDVGANGWADYYAWQSDREPRPLLLEAFAVVGPGMGRQAVDLGSGSGVEARELLRRGWSVLAVDAEPAAAHCLRSRLTGADAERLTTLVARFEDVMLPPAALVHASFALPFCPPWRFDAMWVRLRSVLLRGGVLVGQLFGDRDT